jgi:hypothetical protein
VVTILYLSGCVTLSGPIQEKRADYGAFPDKYQDIAKDYLMTKLRDPSSFDIKNTTQSLKQWIGDKLTGIKYGYLV